MTLPNTEGMRFTERCRTYSGWLDGLRAVAVAADLQTLPEACRADIAELKSIIDPVEWQFSPQGRQREKLRLVMHDLMQPVRQPIAVITEGFPPGYPKMYEAIHGQIAAIEEQFPQDL